MRSDGVATQLKTAEETMLVSRERSESARESRLAAQAEVQVTGQRLEQVKLDRERLEAQRADLEQRLEAERDAFRERKEELASCESKHEAARGELLAVKQRSFDFVQDSAARKGELDLLRVKLEAQEARARELCEELDIEAGRIARLTDEHSQVVERVEASEAACQEHRGGLAEVEERLDEIAMRLLARREERIDLASRLEATRSRHDLLLAMIEAYEGYGDGARALLQRHGGGRVLGTLADHLEAPAGLEAAFDVLLHEALDALLVSDADAAVDLLRELRSERLGRATLLLPEAMAEGDAADLADLRRHAGVVGLAADFLPKDGAASHALRRLLARSVVVEDVNAARSLLAARRDPSLRVATRDGLLWTASGAISGGSDNSRDVQLLGRRRRLGELDEERGVVERELAQVTASLGTLEADQQSMRERRASLEASLRAEEASRHELSLTRATLETSIAEASARRAHVGASLATLEGEIETTSSRLPELASSAERLGAEGDVQARALAEQESAFAALDRERERLRLEVGEVRVAFVTLQGESESHARQVERLEELERELVDLCTRRQDEIARLGRDLERYAAELESAGQKAGELVVALEAERSAQNEVRMQLDAQRREIDAEQERLHEIERARREQQGRRHQVEMALAECRMRRQNLLDRIEEHYKMSEAELLAMTFEWTDADPVPDDGVLRGLRDEIGKLGPVNLLALEEHEEKAARLQFLSAQRQDLVQASTSLTETIDRINRTAHFLFMETFEQIRSNFRETIRTVFDGGEGDLRLVNSEDPLESDIEILVRPRGKRIDTLTQLSSGERALTAIALLFSIYLVKPSPFCVFDEVDAPLDDANIGRFVNLLQEFKDRTQFIVITHNKLTMEAADRLYGVTMEEEGVSKLVTVALDGEVTGAPKSLRKKTDRTRRAAALLQPAAESLAGLGADIEVAVEVKGGNGGGRRPAARLERAGKAAQVHTPEAVTALLEAPEARPSDSEERRV
jgi:chromosome segregation protein